MCLGIQNFKIIENFRISEIFSFQKIHIIDDGSQWRFQVVGNIGDQLCFHTLIFEAFFNGCIKTSADTIDISGHFLLIIVKIFFRNLVGKFAVRDPFQSVKEKFPSKCNFVHPEESSQIQCEKQKKYQKPSIRCRNHDTEEKFKKKKYSKPQYHADPADRISGKKQDQVTGFMKAQSKKMQAFS